MAIPDELKVEHLILLVGGNPLPNYVAARVLAKRGATLHLAHTQKTHKIARRLAECLGLPAESDQLADNFSPPQFIQLDERNPLDIFDKILSLTRDICHNRRVGLHYTGGNRPMSVHAYDAVEEARSDAVFSYLDAGRLEILIHDANRTTRGFRADKLLNMGLETLLKLQGLKEASPESLSLPVQLELATALVALHKTDEGARAWYEWQCEVSKSDGTRLPQSQPQLAQVEAVFSKLCGGAEVTPDRIARAFEQLSLKSCSKWFKSEWLESYALSCVQQAIVGRSDAQDALMNIHRVREDQDDAFELDVVVMRTYQLFVFSCLVSTQDDANKYHAMEAYVRARQTGGDEARVGLVSTHPKPANFERKLLGSLDAAGKIKVFGRGDLDGLADKIREWLDSQP